MNEIDSPIANRRYTCFHSGSGVNTAASPMPTHTNNCCSSDNSNSEPDALRAVLGSAEIAKCEYRKPVSTAMPAISTAIVAVTFSRDPRCGCASNASSGATPPKSANTACHPSHDVPTPSSISSTDQPTTLMPDITRPSASVAQNSHWHPDHA